MKQVFTHLDKLYFPKDNITKGDVIAYYKKIAPFILPYLKNRPQSLKRFPNGIEKPSFFQKNLETHPDWVKTVLVEHSNKDVHYLLIQNVNTLLYAANLGCIEIHPFFSSYQKLNYPDFLVFDLDPEGIGFDKVVETAQVLHEVLEDLKITNLCKTSGATGLHICVPLKKKYSFDEIKPFALHIASLTHKKIPSITSLERNPKNRKKKVYIDCLQNNFGQTIIAPYSLRAKKGAPVSTPLEWKEVKKGLDPLDFTYFNIHTRLKTKGDLFQPLLGKGATILM